MVGHDEYRPVFAAFSEILEDGCCDIFIDLFDRPGLFLYLIVMAALVGGLDVDINKVISVLRASIAAPLSQHRSAKRLPIWAVMISAW